MPSQRQKIITFISIPAAVGSEHGLPIGQYFLYKLIAQQKDVGYKNLLRSDLVTQVRQDKHMCTIRRFLKNLYLDTFSIVVKP